METRVCSTLRYSHTTAVSTKVNVKSPMKWLLLMAVMLIPTLSMGQTTLSSWTLSSNSNTSRSISCGTTYTLNVASSGSGSKDAYCTITSSSNCPITVTLTANDLKPSILMTQTNYVYVYNGSGTGGTQLASWTSETSTGVSVTSTSGTVTIRFDKNTTMSTSATFSVRIYQACCGPLPTTYSCTGDVHQIGSSTNNSSNQRGPVHNFYKYSYTQILYTADEFNYRPGDIKAIAFQSAYGTNMTKKNNVTIYMANVSAENFGTAPTASSFINPTGLQQVYSGNLNCQANNWGWVALDQTFTYTGGALLVAIDDNSGAYDGSSYVFHTSSCEGNRTLTCQSDTYHYNLSNLPTSVSYFTYRPNTKFCVEHNCDPRPDNFAFATQSVSLVAGESYTQNVTGGSNVSYSISCNPAGIASINASTGRVTTVSGNIGTATVTATWPGSNGYCDKTATYTINIGDGCAQVGNGTSTVSYAPVFTYWSNDYGYTQQLYTASEILSAGGCQGTINTIKFNYKGPSTYANLAVPIEVYIGKTSATSLASGWITDAGLTRVYTGTRTFTEGWNAINLSTPIDWDGTSNIVVAIRTTGTSYTMDSYFYGTSITDMGRYYYASTAISLNSSYVPSETTGTFSVRPNIKFCIDCCDDNITGDFHFQYESINYVAGSGAPTANNLVNGTGITSGIIYSSSNTSYVTVTNAGVVTIANNVPEGDYTITAKIPNNNGCDKNASYTIHVVDGCSQVGNGTASYYYTPVYNSGTSGYYSYSQQLYKASEIIAAGGCQGTINDIKFHYATASNFNQTVQVYIGTTGQTTLANAWISDAALQQVYSGTVNFTPGWNTIHLPNGFYWNGVDNIVVAVKNTSATDATSRYFYYTSTTGGARYCTSSSAAITLNGSNVPTVTGTSSTYRPNIRFCIDCCDDIVTETFAFDNPTEVEYVIGSGAFTPPHLTNTTGMTSITYSCSSDAENGSSVGSVNATTGAVTFTGNEGYLTVVAKLAVPNGCDKYTKYRVWVNDGCKRIGTGTVTNSASLINYYKYIWDEMIYKGSEINAGGTINRISVRAVAEGTEARTIKIYMGLTDKNTFNSNTDFIPLSELTQVYSGTRTFTPGWNDFNLSRSFTIPCGKNLVVAFDIDASNYATEYFYATTVTSSCIRAYSDSQDSPLADMSTYTGSTELFAYRPNIKLCISECVCPELSFDQHSVTFCTNGTPQHPSYTCESSGARTWTSSDPSVVRITNATTGAMTVVGVGNCIITLNVAATGQYCAAAASYNVRVMANCPTLHYDLSHCTGTSTPASIPDYVGYGVITLSDVVPQCSTPGMAFAGWCVDPTGDGSYYHPGSSFPLFRDTVLYAIFYTRCCHPDSASVSYIHQTVTIENDSYAVHPNQSIDVSRSSDGYFYYDLCLGEGDGKIHASVNLPDGCTYSNQSWVLNYADGTSLVTNATGNSFEHVIDSVIGYGLTFRARSAEGCWLQLNGRIRVSPGIGVTAAPIESFSVCPENYVPITVGLENEEGVQVTVNRPGTNIQSTLGHAERIFLPDGVACDINGDGSTECGYVSAVNFTDFQAGSVVRSVEDILYLSISLEHSWVGDLFIKVTCPNGQEAVILKKNSSGSTDCMSSIPSEQIGWTGTGTTSAYFGIAYDYTGSTTCDSTEANNAIGTPWTYAWSNNSTRDYEYAGGTYGFVYESANIGHNSSNSIDSSDLEFMRQIYHPEQSFESLVGCPLNGQWYITVMDGWGGDNGWLTDWQLALSEDLAGEVWNYQVDLDTAFMSCTLTNNSKSVTIHSPEISQAGDYDCNLVLVDKFGCLNDNDLNYHFNIKDITVGVDVTGADCGEDNGKIIASVTNGGCGPDALYTYTLVNASNETTVNNSGRFINIGGGDYQLIVECEDGCTKEMTVNVPTTGNVGIEMVGVVHESCTDANDGQITTRVTGSGSGSYTYTLTPGGATSTNGVFSGVEPGTYSVTVEDNATHCQGTLTSIVVNEATPLTLTIATPNTGFCPKASGQNYSITATPGGGSGTYQNYNWSVLVDGGAGTINGTGNNATIASDGRCHEYVVTLALTDANSCPVTASESFATVDNTAPVIATTAVNNQDWGCDPANVTAPTFTATDNCPTPGTALTPTVTAGTIQSNGCTRTQTWTANVTDNCNNSAEERSITYTWTESQAPTIDAIANQPAEMGTSGCKYKMIDLEAVTLAAAHDGCGGTVTFVSQSEAVGTEYTQTDVQQSIPVTVTVKGTCDKQATATVNVIIPAKNIAVDITNTAASVCAGGDTTLTVTGNSDNGALTYTWSPATGLSNTTGASVTATVSTETTYTVTGTDPAGCTATDQITVTINPEVTLSIDNNNQTQCLGSALSPNIIINTTNATLNETELAAACTAIGLTYNAGTISGTATVPGDHTIAVVATSDQNPQCSQKTDNVVIHITNLLTPIITGAEDVCVTASEQNTQVTLNETVGNNTFTYNWNVDGGTIVSGQATNSIVAEWTGDGDKTVTVTLTLNGCQAQATKTIHVHAVPEATITPVTGDVCPNAGTIDITGTNAATTANYTYAWGGGLTLNHNTTSVATPTDVVTATIPAGNCNASYNVTLNVVDNYNCKNTATPITVVVKDETAPVASSYTLPDKDVEGCSSNLATLYPAATTVAELEAAATALGGTLTLSDNCTTDKTQMTLISTETNSGSCPIVVTRKYVVKDLCNNASDTIRQTIRVNVADGITIAEADRTVTVDCPNQAVALSNNQLPHVTDACGTELEPTLDVTPNPAVSATANGGTCNVDSVYTYYYKDCAGHEATWTLKYEVRHPDLRELDSIKYNVNCVDDAVNFTPDTVHDACGNVIDPVENVAARVNTVVAGEGEVSYTWQYTDCEGTVRDRVIYYNIHPSAVFEPTPGWTHTVNCPAQAVEPTPDPREVCRVPINYGTAAMTEDIDITDSCGTRTYTYTYKNPSDPTGPNYTLVYTYNIVPADFTIPTDVATADTVECYDDAWQPTLPTVTNSCGVVIAPVSTDLAVVRDASNFDGCEGRIVYTYTYQDCAGHADHPHTHTWTFIRRVIRTTDPQFTYTPSQNSAVVECLSEAVAPTDLPTVEDVCGVSLNDDAHRVMTMVDDPVSITCAGTRTYTYTFTDCAGHEATWNFTYTIRHTTAPAEKTAGVDGYVTAATSADITCVSAATETFSMPTFLDACGNVLTPSEPVISTVDCEGQYTYTYTYTDCEGLSTPWTFTYNVARTQDPDVSGVAVTNSLNVDCYTDAVVTNIAALPVVVGQCNDTLVALNAFNPTRDESSYANCNGQITYTYNYKDCANRTYDWVFTFNVDMPASTPLAAGDSTVYCESYAVESAIPFPTHSFACGGSHTIAPADQTSVDNNVSGGTGTITYHYGYSDCENNPYTWDFVYHVTPAAVTNPADEYDTVYCVSGVVTPTLPVLPVCDVDVFAAATVTYEGTVNNGCGDTTYVYHYDVNGASAEWRYHYHVEPADFTLPADGSVNVQCYNDEQPDAAIVPVVAAGNGICEAINPSAPVRNADGSDTYNGCEGTVSYTYTYSNCKYSHSWKYTYNVQRTTVPQVSNVATSSNITCADLADGNFTMPTVTDACGVEIPAPTPVISGNPVNCNGTKVYTYTYTDCTNRLTSTFTYTYNINDNVAPTIGTIAQQNATLAGDCQYTIPDLQAMVMAVTTDNCSTPQWVSQEPAAGTVYSSQSTATTVPVVVTVKDECNNTKTAIVNVIVPANSLNLPTIAGVSICDGDAATLVAAPSSNNTPVVCNWTTGTTTVASNTNTITVDPTATTTYMVTATDAAGCSTNRTVVVTVNHPTNTEFTQTVCEGYTWSNHGWSQTYNESGDYTHDYTSAQGCPSTDVLHLTVYHNTNTEYTETACDSYTWTNHGLTQTYTTSGNYQHNYTTTEGCPSTDVLHLTVNHNSSATYTETVCDSYTWNNHGWSQEYTASGTYTHAYMSAEGCPSTDVLTLTVNQSGTGSLYVTQCEEYTWYGANYNTSGDYQHHLTTVRGCDSLVTLHLTIINSYYVDLYDTVCFGASYSWYGNTYTQPGDYEHLLVSQNGCDSTLTMHLYQLPVVRVGIDAKPDCHTGSYKLTVSSINSDQYEWWSEPDNGDLASQQHETEVTVTPLVNTTYYAKAWAAGHEECAASTSLKLEPVKIPRAAIDAHPSYLTIDRTDWNATDRSVGGTWRMWYVDGEYYSGDPHISGQIVPAIDSLELVLIIGTDDCADTAHRTIPYKNVGLWLPNVFTPAQDNNNYFGPEGSGIIECEMWVYNREGLLVFHSESMNDRWDGKHKGENCPQGSYTYRVAYKTVAEPESEMEVVGTVTILR